LVGSGNARVLVVDDTDVVRRMICRALSAGGYEVDTAATYAEASGLDPACYDAMLIDVKLGAYRGTDLLEVLRSKDPAAAGRCLMMSGSLTDGLPEGVACLAKPFKVQELLDAVRALDEPRASAGPGKEAMLTTDSGAAALASRAPDENRAGAHGSASAWLLLDIVRRVRAREQEELADFLHDGPIQELTAMTLQVQLLRRSLPSASLSSGSAQTLELIQQQLDVAASALRRLMDGPSPLAPTATSLADAVRQRTARLVAEPIGLDIAAEQTALRPSETRVVADILELVLLGTVATAAAARAHAKICSDENQIKIEVTLADRAPGSQAVVDPAAGTAWLHRLAAALGARAHYGMSDQQWRVSMTIDRQS
jgi:DNA-binding response OmpR family regulator